MKFSVITTDKSNTLRLSTMSIERFMERISHDTKAEIITTFRERISDYHNPTTAARRAGIPRVCPAVELRRQHNDTLGMARFNGLVTLEVKMLPGEDPLREAKAAAMRLPWTLAAFVGASGASLKILVRVADGKGRQLENEAEAERLYERAYRTALPYYDAALKPYSVTRMEPSLRHSFLQPLDEKPSLNLNATPLPVAAAMPPDEDDAYDHLLRLPLPTESAARESMERYAAFERTYITALDTAFERTQLTPAECYKSPEKAQEFLTALATELCRRGVPEEEAISHIWHHWRYRNVEWLTEDSVRAIVEAVFAETQFDRRYKLADSSSLPMHQIMKRLQTRYLFRRNTVMGYTEYRPNVSWLTGWRPVDDNVIRTFTTDLILANVNAWEKDVKRVVFSNYTPDYDPIQDYLSQCRGRWSGRDHIGELADSIPTDTPQQWRRWFHIWFLGMVAQWMGFNRRFGNSLVPLLVSPQGQHKSSFCRQLLPPELRRWGYTDHLPLTDERAVHLAMGQMLLINLDEFNAISAVKQEGLLKNLIQLSTVKAKRPYGRHIEEVPRLASFIATTNMPEVLTDITGSRRFIGVQVTGSIDVSLTPNYEQLFAQAQAELYDGQRYWLDDAETAELMEHNRRFQRQDTNEAFFLEFLEPATPDAGDGEWMSTAAIITYLKQCARSSFSTPSANMMGRVLSHIPGLRSRHDRNGTVYFVRKR